MPLSSRPEGSLALVVSDPWQLLQSLMVDARSGIIGSGRMLVSYPSTLGRFRGLTP